MEKPSKTQKPLLRLYDAITLSNLWLSILSLANDEQVYAYTLADAINKKFGFKPSRLLVYLVLYKLEASGYLKSHTLGKRNYYAITNNGKLLLDQGKKLLNERANEV
jgi:DNA-binding PadR family transcriptional regulator